MYIRKCKKCGWEYAGQLNRTVCTFCGGGVVKITNICAKCGKEAPKLHNGRCQACHTADHQEWTKRRRNKAKDEYDAWLTKISKTDKKTLTEEQWMNACKHFGGCAYCGTPEIDVRSMFVPFKDGGRYCAWNIIPSCEICENVDKEEPNPFARMDNKLNRCKDSVARKYDFSLDKLNKIVDYLQSKIEVNDDGNMSS